MSDGYAARLKHYPHKGVCGLPESIDSPRVYQMKLKQLKELLSSSRNIVVFTGAGISTAAGIPDFRGPLGIWTVEQRRQKEEKRTAAAGQKKKKEKKRKRQRRGGEEANHHDDDQQQQQQQSEGAVSTTRIGSTSTTMDFATALPTLTHRAVTRWILDNHVQFCVTQNVDGLHRRSGLSRDRHAVLHGCVFTETCGNCHGREYFRDYEVGGMSFQPTGRQCDECGGPLCDTLLDWEDPLPQVDLDRATQNCTIADLVLCLGTSLRIQPAGSLPALARKFVIVNLQETPEDQNAALVIRERVDKVVLAIMQHFGYGEDWSETDPPPVEYIWQPPPAETETEEEEEE